MASTFTFMAEDLARLSAVDKTGSAELLEQVRKELAPFSPKTLSGEVAKNATAVHATCSTRLTKKFEGDDWKLLVARAPELLRQTFVLEACQALDVAPEAISNVELRLGSLYVTFHVTHDEDITEDEMEQRIEEYPFHEMWRLYQQRDGSPDGLDAALQKIKDLEAQLKEKNRELDQNRDENAHQIAALEEQLAELEQKLEKAAEREKELLDELSKEQQARKKAEAALHAAEEMNKKLVENLKREKQRFEKAAQRQNELIAAIIQENKKEKEAKEREYNEQLDVKEFIIENLKEQLRTRTNGDATPQAAFDNDQTEEFSKLMARMEELTSMLQSAREVESAARAEIQRLTELLRQSEDSRHAESISYENNVGALQLQLKAFRDTKLAEEHEKRAEESRSSRRSGTANVNREMKENETIVRQYEASLQNIVGTILDRLKILQDEFVSYLNVSQQEIDNEKNILEEHEEDSKGIRQAFRAASLSLQKVFWNTREGEVPGIISELDTASANAEKSSAAVKVTVAMLDSKKKGFSEQRDWMDAHQQSMKELIQSLTALNKRAFERQLTLVNNTSANAANA